MKTSYKHKICHYVFGCKFSSYGGGHGFCPLHYGAYFARVKRGSATWKEIIDRTLHHYDLTETGREYLKCRENNSHLYPRKVYTLMPEDFILEKLKAPKV
jgi:hypothetical protein